MTPEKLALTISVGFAIGVFPMFGLTTLFSAAIAVYLRLNMPIIQAVNYMMYPLQLLLFIPLVNVGDFVFDIPSFPFTLSEVINMFEMDLLGTLKSLWLANMRAIVGWLIVAVPVAVLTYFLTLPLFRKLDRRFNRAAIA